MKPRDRNRHATRAAFREELLALEPRSVLDVGCGAGELLAELAALQVEACGVESSPDRLLETGSSGVVASAARLPFRSASRDVVALRHVLHHLPDPRAAVREAARVAARALVLAEPWLDPVAPGADLAQRLEDWSRLRDRRAGRCHEADHTPDEIAALLPGSADDWSVRVRRVPGVARISAQELRDELAAERDPELRELLAHLPNDGLPLSGSAVVVAVRAR